VEALAQPKLRTASLKTLTREVVGVLINKPKPVTMGNWDMRRLSVEQVHYACIDTFVSYEIGRLLLSGQCAELAATGAMISPFIASVVPVA
jgi:ribonuclease D